MSTAQDLLLFTHGLEPGLASQVRRIPSAHTHFATNFMGYPASANDVDPAATRLEATLDPATDTWQIERFTKMPNGLNTIRQQMEARPGLCFFDALHYLARFEKTETDLDKRPVDVPGSRWDVPHFKIAARDSHQVFDADGQLQPCAYGRILAEGFFSNEAYETASATKTMPLLSHFKTAHDKFLNDMISKLISTQPVTAPAEILLQKSIERQNAVTVINKTIDTWDGFFREIGVSTYFNIPESERSIKDRLLFQKEKRPQPQIYKSFENCVAVTSQLPSGATKELCILFAKATEITLAIETAAYSFAKGSPEQIRAGLPYIAEAAKLMSLPPVDSERLTAAYLNGMKPGEHAKILSERWQPGGNYHSSTYHRAEHDRHETLIKASVCHALKTFKEKLQSLEI